MKTIEELLKNLARPEVLEFGLVTNRLPSVNIGGKFEPVDDEAPSTERLMQMLVTMGGSRYVDSLSDKPVQWTTRLDGVGVIAVAAILRKDIVQARFTVAKREGAGSRPSTQQQSAARASDNLAAQPASGASVGARSSAQQPVARAHEVRQAPAPSPQPTSTKSPPASAPQAQAHPASSQTRAQPVIGQPSSSTIAAAKAASGPIQPQVIKSVGTAPAAQPVRVQPSPHAPPVHAPPPPSSDEEWDDDDEPTLQTLSPPVSGAPGAVTGEARPKPARRPEEVARPDADAEHAAQEKAAQEKAAAERAAQEKAAQEKAAQEKAAQEKAAAEKAAAEKAAAERAAAERAAQEKAAAEKAPAEKAAAERAAQEKAAQEKAAQEKAAAERAAQEKAAQEKAAAERAAQERATQERVMRERAALEQRAAQERSTRERAAASEALRLKSAPPPSPGMGGRRISTPTSVDVVDVEITTNDPGGASRTGRLDLDLDGAMKDGARFAAAASAAATPATAPAVVAEKDRPRVDASAAVDSFLAMAVAARASDLYIVSGRPILLRVATDLLPRTQSLSAEHVERITREIVPARLRETLEKEGSCDFAVEHPAHGRFRVNVSKVRTGYKLVLRVIPKELPTIAGLGLPAVVLDALRHQRGLILVTGPASQGKSTTLAALVDHLNRETARHIMTIEEPIEHVHPRKKGFVSQRDVGLHARTRARTLQTTLREDADTIVLGEIRDAESARHALVACEGGRLVLGTMNTPTASKTIERILSLFQAEEAAWARGSLASSLRLVIGQRLVPSADRTRLHAAIELLPWSVALYTLVRDGRAREIPELQKRGKAAGVVRLDESLAELVRAHKITADVAKQFAESPVELDAHAARSAGSSAAQARKG